MYNIKDYALVKFIICIRLCSLSKQLSTKKLHEKKQLPDIRCCTAISTGFIYSENAGEVTYFERINKLR